MDIYAQMVEKIINTQEGIIGPIALEQAKKVNGLKLDWKKHDIQFEGDKKEILEGLIEQYKRLFGQTSVEMCKDAVREITPQMPADQVPEYLK